MDINTRNLVRYFIALVIFVSIFLYFKGVRWQVFQGITYADILVALIFGVIIALFYVARIHFQFRFLNKPLWGFEEAPERYEDTSLKKHKSVVIALILVVVITIIFILFGSNGML